MIRWAKLAQAARELVAVVAIGLAAFGLVVLLAAFASIGARWIGGWL